MRLKKLLRISTLPVLAFGLVLTGCSAKETAKNEPVTVTVWMGSWYQDQIPKIEAAYQKEHPNIKLHIEPIPINGYLDKAISATLGGNPPDLLDLDAFMISTMAGKNLLLPWDDSIKDLDVKDFAKGIWDAGVLNNKVYALPNRSSSTIMYYDKTLFDAAGVPYPTENWTYQDMMETAKKLTIPGKQYGLGIAAALSDPANVMSSFAPMVWAFGGDFIDKANNKFVLNEPNGIKAIEFLTNLYTKEKVVPEGTLNYSTTKDIVPMFVNHKVAMFASGSENIEPFKQNKDLKFGIVSMPQKVNVGGGYAFTIPSTAAHPKEARDFALWYIQPDHLSSLAIRQPSRISATTSPPWNSPEFKIVFNSAPNSRILPTIPQWGEIQTIIITELQKVLQGSKSPKQAADDMAAQANALLQKK